MNYNNCESEGVLSKIIRNYYPKYTNGNCMKKTA